VSIAVDVSREGVRAGISADRVRAAVIAVCTRESVRNAMISVAFITNRRMARMNREYLGHRGATDILTFELARERGAVVGDIYIAPDVARANAADAGVTFREEITRLIVHGTLHVLGYTHAEDDHRTTGEMWHRQERLVAALA
jgi:probable rRNA maturation factor